MPALIDWLRPLMGFGLAAGLAAPCPAGAASPYRLEVRSGDYQLRIPGPAAGARTRPARALTSLIERHARTNGLDPALVQAVIGAESGYQAGAVSSKGAVGLMQVMPATGRRFGITDLADPDANLRAGTAYLSHLLALFDDLPLALAAYNAGEGAVIRHGYRIPPYPETRSYVQGILQSYGRKAPARPPFRPGYLDGTRLEAGLDLSAYRLRRP